MDLAAIDQSLARLRSTIATMSSNLVDLETDTARGRLDQAPLTGATAQRWSSAQGSLAALWQWFAQLSDLAEQATKLRGTRPRIDGEQLAQLDRLVNGPSIELSTAGIPLSQRGLFGAAEATSRCSPAQLLEQMQAAFQQVMAVIDACNEKWHVIEPRLVPLEQQLQEAQHLAAGLGENDRVELGQVRAEMESLRQVVQCDPLAAPDDAGATVATSLAAVIADLHRLAQLRDGLAAQLTASRRLLADLEATTEAARVAQGEAMEKIACPAVVDPPPVAGDLAAMLERVTDVSGRGDWRAAANLLAQWTTRAQAAAAAAGRALAANRAPLATRNELRGRLDAYRAKAYRLGLLEDERVAGLYARARGALFTAPTDLNEAEQLVGRYQQALTGPAPREVAT
ncbi:MAG: hypothetical protein QOK39_1038 [Acidimicrobiaceae bacterium]|nr:hypothetical protein [Acidimicrobiaceae bacterium]